MVVARWYDFLFVLGSYSPRGRRALSERSSEVIGNNCIEENRIDRFLRKSHVGVIVFLPIYSYLTFTPRYVTIDNVTDNHHYCTYR